MSLGGLCSDQSQQSELTGVNEHVHVRGSPLIYHAEFSNSMKFHKDEKQTCKKQKYVYEIPNLSISAKKCMPGIGGGGGAFYCKFGVPTTLGMIN